MPDPTLPSMTDPENDMTNTESAALAPESSVTEEAPAVPPVPPGEELLEDEIEEELIIEDFTIDGICGVY
ncbi:MAG TPA: mycofactocin precursor MftA [Ktedonobacteraceae bacterium]|nr:mycofactocin precursor MftA [Ktedonobacteraceae bacterium]